MDYLISLFEQAEYRVPALMRIIATSENFFAITPLDNEGEDSFWVSTNKRRSNDS